MIITAIRGATIITKQLLQNSYYKTVITKQLLQNGYSETAAPKLYRVLWFSINVLEYLVLILLGAYPKYTSSHKNNNQYNRRYRICFAITITLLVFYSVIHSF